MANVGEIGEGLQRAADAAGEGTWQFLKGIRDQQRVTGHIGSLLEGLDGLVGIVQVAKGDNEKYQEHVTSAVVAVGQGSEELRSIVGQGSASPKLASAITSLERTQNDGDSALERGWEDSKGVQSKLDEALTVIGALRTVLQEARGHSGMGVLSMISGISFAEGGVTDMAEYAEGIGVPLQLPNLPGEGDYAPQ